MLSNYFSKRRTKAYAFLLGATILWGASAPIIKYTLSGISPFEFLAYRFFVAGTVGILIIMFGSVPIPKSTKLLYSSLIYGVVATTIALSTLFIGIHNSTVLDLALIGNSGPLLVMLGGWIIFRDHITHREKIGTIITLTGTALVVIGPLLLNSNIAKLTGNLFLLAFLVIDAATVLFSKYLAKKKVSPVFIANAAFVVGAITLIPFVINYYGFSEYITTLKNLDIPYHLGVWYMAILSGNVAYSLFVRGVRTIEVSEAGLFAYLQPLISTPLAVLWLGEAITPIFIIGAIIITAGVFIAEKK